MLQNSYYFDLDNRVDDTKCCFCKQRKNMSIFKKYGLQLMQSIFDGSWAIYRASDKKWSELFPSFGDIIKEGKLNDHFVISHNGKFNAINLVTLDLLSNHWYNTEDEMYMCYNVFIG